MNLLCNVTNKQIYVVLRDFETAMTENFREGNHVSAVQDPLFCERMSVPMEASSLHAAPLIILIKHVISCAPG